MLASKPLWSFFVSGDNKFELDSAVDSKAHTIHSGRPVIPQINKNVLPARAGCYVHTGLANGTLGALEAAALVRTGPHSRLGSV